MILLDSRIGSKHLVDLIPGAVLTQLESADACFEGNGVTVGIEIKRLMDAVQCMYTGRLADHQIPLMKAQYDFCYLLIEGVYRPCPKSGVLQYLRLFNESPDGVQCGRWTDASSGGPRGKRLMYQSFESWLLTLETEAGMSVKNSPSTAATAATLMALWHWWNKSQHHSFHVLDETTESAVLTRPTMNRRIIALLPRIGWSRSGILAKRFKSVAEMVAAPPEAWFIEGEIALPTAKKIWESLHGVSNGVSND